MSPSEIASFLLPQFHDPLQVFFLTLIVGMMAYAVGGAHFSARPSEWQKKWDRGTPDDESDDLDIEHGSVTDLWNAVATSHEKLAEMMPGLLLVVGLLGTFIGLGLALDHASSILGLSNVASASGAADSMNELMGLLEGLGTKFKTSTWGLCGFLILQVWRQVFRFEEKRLAWVIEKVKCELEKRRDRQALLEKEKQNKLYEQIALASSHVVGGLHGPLELIHKEARVTSSSMVSFTGSIAGIVKEMSEAGVEMASGATRISEAASGLNGAVDDFSEQFKAVLDNVRKDLSISIHDMSETSAKTMAEGSQKLEGATQEISAALASLSNDIKMTLGEVQGSIKESLQIQNKAFSLFDTTSQTLNVQIEKSTKTAGMMKDSIDSGLQGVANASRNAGSAAKKMEGVAEKIEAIVTKLDKQNRGLTSRILRGKQNDENKSNDSPESRVT